MNKELLFVQPDFPTSKKSINHSSFLPIGLLKMISYYREQGYYIDDTQLVKGEVDDLDFTPKKIFITTLFTYWYGYVARSINFYKNKYPLAEIYVGGILATLLPEKIKEFGNNIKITTGVDYAVEDIAYKVGAAYDIVDKHGVDYQIVHAMRGCVRKCKFCGTWRLEERKDYAVDDVIDYIIKCATIGKNERRRIIFYDNNFLAHDQIEELLTRLSEVKIKGKPLICESQSGFDGRILMDNPKLAELIKKARFQRPKIAWDNDLEDADFIKKQIDLLVSTGYKYKEISIFMIYNWDYSFETMIEKLRCCWEWQVQISDCRFRPLNVLKDDYDSKEWRKGQTEKDYYIHTSKGWSDYKIRFFRKLVRQQNIMVRQEWGPGQYEQWKSKQKVSKVDMSNLIWPEYHFADSNIKMATFG